ncbi:MAG: PQQ-binding-like beta-propeller repeat protein, partial [candidate division Zixibacteria bacterium]|nr:PQQ-binding-like beta-propeller repeat protein [candidate division Zixibacteria bacterium]
MFGKRLIACMLTGILLGAFAPGAGSESHSDPVTPVVKLDLTHPGYQNLMVAPQYDSEFNRPLAPGALHPVSPTKMNPLDYFCDGISYGDDLAYFWEVPGATYGDIYQNMRFTSVAGYNCTLYTAYVAVYPAAFMGTPDMEILVWDDDGFGFPGTLRATVTIPYTSLPTSLAYVTADLRPFGLVYSDGAEYHIGVNCPNSGAGNVLAILSDNGASATGRHSFYLPGDYPAGWYVWTADYAYTMAVDYCAADIPYSWCYRLEYNCSPYYLWPLPDAYGNDYFSMRFSPYTPETLMTVGLAFFDYGDQSGDVDIFVWGDDAGFPDLTNVLYQTTVAFADIVYYPDYLVVDLSAETIILREEYHVGWSPNDITGGLAYGISDDGACGALRSSVYHAGGWETLYDNSGVDVNFLMYSYGCEDEFAECRHVNNACNLAVYTSLPSAVPDGSGNNVLAIYEGFEPYSWEPGCRLDSVFLALYDRGIPTMYTSNSEVRVYASDGLTWNGLPGAPGTLLGQVTLTPADYVFYPAMTPVDVLSQDIRFEDKIWVGIHSLAPDPEHGIAILADDGTCGGPGSALWWDDNSTSFSARNRYLEAAICCKPGLPPNCPGGDDWPTCGHDFRRSGHSWDPTGDARCKQDILWWTNEAAGMNSNRPVISDGKLIVAFNTKLVAYDINTAAVLWTVSGMPTIGSAFRNTPTVADGYVYFGGGNIPAFNKADVNTGTLMWSRTITTTPLTGNSQYTTSVILTAGSQDGIFFQTEDGKLQGLDIATGADLPGYPIQLNGVGTETISSNGVDVLYVGTDGTLGAGGCGSLYAIDVATGAILWQLDEADLAGHDIDKDTLGTVTKEVFRGPIAVDDDGSLYVLSSFASEVSPGSPPSGARYCIDPTGDIIWAVGGTWQGTTSSTNGYTAPIIDDNLIYVQSLRYWTSESPFVALRKSTGAVMWKHDGFYTSTSYIEGALSCEIDFPNRLYVGNNNANFMAVNADNGVTEFGYQYYVGSGKSYRSTGIAIDPTHVVFTNRNGDVYVMSEQV